MSTTETKKMNRLDYLDYINKTVPVAIAIFKLLGIDRISAPEGDINYYLHKDKDAINFHKESYDASALSQNIGSEFYTDNDALAYAIYMHTKNLKTRLRNIMNEKMGKLSDLFLKLE